MSWCVTHPWGCCDFFVLFFYFDCLFSAFRCFLVIGFGDYFYGFFFGGRTEFQERGAGGRMRVTSGKNLICCGFDLQHL